MSSAQSDRIIWCSVREERVIRRHSRSEWIFSSRDRRALNIRSASARWRATVTTVAGGTGSKVSTSSPTCSAVTRYARCPPPWSRDIPLGHTSACAPATPIRHPYGSSSSLTRHNASNASSARASALPKPEETICTTQSVRSNRQVTVASRSILSRLTVIARDPPLIASGRRRETRRARPRRPR